METLRLSKRNIVVVTLASLVTLSLLLTYRLVWATPSSGLTPMLIASGVPPDEIRAKFKVGEGGFSDGTLVKEVKLIQYTLAPGGTFGWHQHAGPVWAIIASGTLSLYAGDDPTCTPHFYGAGSALLDEGSHTQTAINETDEPVVIYATFMLPEGGDARVDAADPGNCS